MTNLERVCMMYNLILPLLACDKKITVKTKFFSVDFYKDEDSIFHMHTEKVDASSEYLHSLYDLVSSTIADKSLCEDIEIIADNEIFAIFKN